MDTTKKGKSGVVGALVVIAVIAIGYYVFTREPQNANVVSTSTELQTSQAVLGKNLLVSLLELKKLNLDQTFFDNALFNSLQDFSVTLVPVPVGRPNPFLPTGGASAGSAAAATLAQ